MPWSYNDAHAHASLAASYNVYNRAAFMTGTIDVPGVAQSGTILATKTLTWNTASGRAIATADPGAVNIDVSGTATKVVLYTQGDPIPTSAPGTARRFVGTVGTSGADANVSSTTFTAGGTVDMAALTFTFPS